MVSKTRRDFIRDASVAVGSVAALSAMPPGIRNALAMPANNRTGTIKDIEHIVVLMQENRSFDHYLGAMSGVRGFNDPRAIKLPNGDPVWRQPANTDLGYLQPFHPQGMGLGSKFLDGTPHDWNSTHKAWNGGRYDQWVPNKGEETMAHLKREDIPFHYRLAEAFTICDAYHSSGLLATNPNRYYMFTGWTGNDGKHGYPVIGNYYADQYNYYEGKSDLKGYSWPTFPEQLEKAGVSWKFYQDIGGGLDAEHSWGYASDKYTGNYGCNPLLYFAPYQQAQPGDSLYERARTGTNVANGDHYLDDLKRDVDNGTLPQVSFITAPEAFCEHPYWPPNYGAWYIDQVLQILTSNPDTWSKTAVLINYDENDGYFDHMAPPVAPAGDVPGRSTVDTANEYMEYDAQFDGYYQPGPYGIGPRVPMFVVSPWSKGGFVCSQVFDHTSVIQFIEKRFGEEYGLRDPNITAWRRAVCGDLTAAFDFKNPNDEVPSLGDTSQFKPTDHPQNPARYDLKPRANAGMAVQESGQRHARPLPYEATAGLTINPDQTSARIAFKNSSSVGTHFTVYTLGSQDAPRQYTVGAGQALEDDLPLGASGRYDLAVHGPNGFYRRFMGNGMQQTPQISERYNRRGPRLELYLEQTQGDACKYHVTSHYDGKSVGQCSLKNKSSAAIDIDLRATHGWYDVSVTRDDDPDFEQRFAGHVETGKASVSDPALNTSHME